jgi:hypothetical protein
MEIRWTAYEAVMGAVRNIIHEFREETPNATELLRIPSIQVEPQACTTD